MLFKIVIAAIFASTTLAGALEDRRETPYFTPSELWKYNTRDGAISTTEEGVVSKATNNGGNDLTALVTFTYPDESKGKKCQFAFYLDSTASVSGSGKLDVFTSFSPAPGSRSSWPPGNQRNLPVGRLSVAKGAAATWDATFNAYLTQKSDCKAPGTKEGLELVGVHDTDYISWNPKVAGPRILYT